MLIDCDTCSVRGVACDGCVVNAMLQIRPQVRRLDATEAGAIEVLSRAGFEVTVLDDLDDRRRGRSGNRSAQQRLARGITPTPATLAG